MNIIEKIQKLRPGHIVGQRMGHPETGESVWIPETKMSPDDLIALAERYERLLEAAKAIFDDRHRGDDKVRHYRTLWTIIKECEENG